MSRASAIRKHHTIFVVDETLLRGARARTPTLKLTMLAVPRKPAVARPHKPPKLEKPPCRERVAELSTTSHECVMNELRKLSSEALTEFLSCKEDSSFLYSSDEESNTNTSNKLGDCFEPIKGDAKEDSLPKDLESLDSDFFSSTDELMKLASEMTV